MTSASPNHIATEYTTIPIEDVEVIEGSSHEVSHPKNNYVYNNPEINNSHGDNPKSKSTVNESSALVNPGSAGSNFSEFLVPLTKDTFVEAVKDVEEKLKTVNQTLGMLNNLLEAQGFDAILHEMLRSITLKTGELLNADRTTIWLLDEEKNELWSTVAQGANGKPLELRIPANVGIAGESAQGKKVINIPYDFYDDPRSTFTKKFDKQNGYRTYSMVVMPLLQEETGDLIAVVQLLNKFKLDAEKYELLEEKIDVDGFTEEDERLFREFAPSISLILESSKSFYAATQRQRAAEALMKAVDSLSKSSLDLEDTLKKVMDQAKELMNADRSTLWLIDNDKNQLWTKIPVDGKLIEIRIAKDKGFAGVVATSGEPLLIPFDVYKDSRSVTAKETDEKTGYRTCSLLCMPVFNADHELIGVTQLINKKKQGEYPAYNPADWPNAPEQWRASFNRNDLEFMKAFNIQAGVALQNAKLFDTVKQEQQRQRDILRSLTNGVISTDKKGKVIATNESARHLLGIGDTDILAGKSVKDLVCLKEGEFSKWLDLALSPNESKESQQYYPDQTLFPQGDLDPQSINLSINSMIDVLEPEKVNGVLVVMEDISGEKQVKNLMYRYMTPEVAEQLLASGDTGLGGKRQKVSVLFSDIRSYTTLTESMSAEQVVSMLNEYFEEMVDAVFKYKGTLDKYIGDALMAVFGSPAPLADHPLCAMQTAVEMRQRLKEFNKERVAKNKKAISIGMGIHSDEVVSGNIGSSKRMELTSIGDGVNLASRLEGTSKQYGTDLVISENTYQPYKEKLWVRELDLITVKGKSKPVRIYELLGFKEGALKQDLSDKQHQIVEHYHQGREYYLRPSKEKNLKDKDIEEAFVKAEAEFKKVLNIDPKNKAAELHVGRCQLFQAELPPKDWDGVWKLTEK
ncbi:MAG: adenylate/guanylate cyclase domain-containing protein [Trichodesmium sp. MO_231.B1]|nr:adenylate/guanylate cyclase domain-containing protein [Trichodesmium sp. MO_231.B1]